MVRNYVRKTDRETPSKETIEMAVKKVLMTKQSIRSVAKSLKISPMILYRNIRKQRESKSMPEDSTLAYIPNYSIRKVFSHEQETLLKDYLVTLCKMHQGLTIKMTTEIAYQLAIVKKLKIPASWEKNKAAGVDWCLGFRKRHPDLAICCSEKSGRPVNTDDTNVIEFYTDLEKVYAELGPSELHPGMIYTLDEKVLTSLHNPSIDSEEEGRNRMEKLSPQERAVELVTVCCFINAAGYSVPPYLIFPEENFTADMLIDAPPGAGGNVSKSGWMTVDTFVYTLEHFQKIVGCTKESPIVLILDNHNSHTSLQSLTFCKDNGIIIVTLPPYTATELQPLNVTIFKSLKTCYNTVCSEYILVHPGKTITVHKVASLFGEAYIQAFVLSDIIKGFEVTGIWPLTDNVLKEDESSSVCVNDRLTPVLDDEIPSTSGCIVTQTTIAGFSSSEKLKPLCEKDVFKNPDTNRQNRKSKHSSVKNRRHEISSMKRNGKVVEKNAEINDPKVNEEMSLTSVLEEEPNDCQEFGEYILSDVLETAVILEPCFEEHKFVRFSLIKYTNHNPFTKR